MKRIDEDFEMNAINSRKCVTYVEATSHLRLVPHTMPIEFTTCRLENIIIN